MDKRLYRNTETSMIAGVCSGLADYVGYDPAIWRLVTVFLTVITAGGFIIVYIAAWIIVPAAPVASERVREVEYTAPHE